MAKTTEQHSSRSTAAADEAVTAEHLVHGLIAIANGPDYCLCGGTWPCDRQEGRLDSQPR